MRLDKKWPRNLIHVLLKAVDDDDDDDNEKTPEPQTPKIYEKKSKIDHCQLVNVAVKRKVRSRQPGTGWRVYNGYHLSFITPRNRMANSVITKRFH